MLYGLIYYHFSFAALQEEEGWWEGTLNGKTGMFPSNFVEIIEDQKEEYEGRLPYL